MTAPALLDTLRARGVILLPAGDRLRYCPRDAVTGDLRAALIVHKAELLALLRETAPALERPRSRSYFFPWPDALEGLGGRRVVTFGLCADCGAGSWVAYGPRVLCLRCARRWAEPAP